MKSTLFLLVLTFSLKASALCEVYGISDSPQSLRCQIGNSRVELTCKDSVYYLNETPVEAAFHYEVEAGPSPLVFKTFREELTVTMDTGRIHKATLLSDLILTRGQCR